MVHYYLYIICGATLDEDSRFYKVGIGESTRQVKLRVFLESYALEHGHFFTLWDNDAVSFLVRCLDSVGKPLSQVHPCLGVDFVRQLKDGNPEPYSLHANMQRQALLQAIDPAYYSLMSIRRKK